MTYKPDDLTHAAAGMTALKTPCVSIIVPAHNAAATLAETVDSLFEQTYAHWEAIIVDDGSSDETLTIANTLAAQDKRLRTVSQPQRGASAARNRGISLARFDWLLFLDSDDWLVPRHLEKMTARVAEDPTLDAVHCGWARIASDGTRVGELWGPEAADLFDYFTVRCVFAIHACIVRKALIEAHNGFDVSLKTCEEWDLWQRIARTGARFGVIPQVLALYRMRENSLSVDGTQLLKDGLRVVMQGHAFDPRVVNPLPEHARGAPAENLPGVKLLWLAWVAGLILGVGKKARHLLDVLGDDDIDPKLNLQSVAGRLFHSIALPTCKPPSGLWQLWLDLKSVIDDFLEALEARSRSPGLARRIRLILERMILQRANAAGPVTIGLTHAVCVETTEPIVDISPPEGVERLCCILEMEGFHLGSLELPVCDARVAGPVLADAIAAVFFWAVLGRFFQRTIYPALDQDSLETFHNQTGWTVFLQQLWNRPDWTQSQFYDSSTRDETHPRPQSSDGWIELEVSADLPALEVTASELKVLLTVGGTPLGVIPVPVEESVVTAQALRAALTQAGGLELCRVCVREGLLGRSLTDSTPLRVRLADAARVKVNPELPYNAIGLGRRPAPLGTSASRRAAMPVASSREVLEAAVICGDPVVQNPPPGVPPRQLLYLPDQVRLVDKSSSSAESGGAPPAFPKNVHGRSHFESLFAKQPDPWKYTSPYEQTKYEQTLSLLPPGLIDRALEIGCTEGHFTFQLAARVRHYTAADISQIALERTAKRCAEFKHIQYQQLDLTRDPLPGRFDLIVCSEMLYFLGGITDLVSTASKLTAALVPGGYLLMAHAHVVVDEPDRAGFDWDVPFGAKTISDTFNHIQALRLIKEFRTPLYRIQLFQRQRRLNFFRTLPRPQITRLEQQPTALLPEVAAHVLWQGGHPQPQGDPAAIVTERLPILMYHRIASTGSARMNRWRLTPQSFDGQLRYLRDAGYYSVNLETWRLAMAAKEPLPGRAVLMTFDDGYLDFYKAAWPLLKKYGFSAIIFLVADCVGQSACWDDHYGEELPLMNWAQIRQLQAAGLHFGSHSASHRPLTGLSAAEIVKEGARSRAILTRELGISIDAIAYPYGDTDQAVEHLIGACGYVFGLSCRQASSCYHDSLLSLPRIEITGFDGLRDFVTKLSS